MKNYILVVLIAVLQAPFSLPCHYGWTYDWTEVNEVMKDLTQAAKLEGAALLVADDFNEATKEPVLAYENYQNGYTRKYRALRVLGYQMVDGNRHHEDCRAGPRTNVNLRLVRQRLGYVSEERDYP